MKAPIITIFLILIYCSLAGQDPGHQPLDKLGWDVINFSIPEDLTELDTGRVNYLLNLSHEGQIRHIELLENSFDSRVEKLWQVAIKKSAFKRSGENSTIEKKHKGTFFISRAHCNQPVGTPEQIELFHKP
ncbi:MAG: hypothetical protein WD824_05585 [Cyclobacteriaceae bacterium]